MGNSDISMLIQRSSLLPFQSVEEPPKHLPSNKIKNYGYEFDCSGFDQMSAVSSCSITSSESFSSQDSSKYALSRSHCVNDLSSLCSSSASYSSIRRQPQHSYSKANDFGSWGYFVDTPQR
jgi:hypothetical protein